MNPSQNHSQRERERETEYYKHFSHPHNLIFHHLQQGVEIHCSGCKLPGSGSVYFCWHCSFFLHEQCFHASRSMQHPSHPSHPLNLVPYPTYPSTSFICNSCNLSGTGFSYCCSLCDFDLHVHCSYTPQIFTYESYSNVPNLISFSSPSQTLSFKEQYAYNIPETSIHEPVLNGPSRVPIFNAQMGPEISSHEPILSVPSSNAQMGPASTEPLSRPDQPTHVSDAEENQPQPQKVKHFSHHHDLNPSVIQEEDEIVCYGCEQELSSFAYSCTMPNCNFYLHKSCFELPREIQHKSHPDHPLILLSSPPYKEGGEFTCNACLKNGCAFTYHCSTCNFDLHVNCAFLSETMKREDHEHPLSLLYSSPYKKVEEDEEDMVFICSVCHGTVDEHCWVYYCQECDYGTDLGCVTAEEYPEEESVASSALAAQIHLRRLQLEMEMSKQTAQLIINMGQSLANLV